MQKRKQPDTEAPEEERKIKKLSLNHESCTIFHADDHQSPESKSFAVYYDDDSHTYRFHITRSDPAVVSVTTLIKSFFSQFQPRATAERMLSKGQAYDAKHSNNPDALLHGCVTETEIVNRWQSNGDVARERGTNIHHAVCEYMNAVFPCLDHHEAVAQFTMLGVAGQMDKVAKGRRMVEFEIFVKQHRRWFEEIIKWTNLGSSLDEMCFICEVPVGQVDAMLCGTPDLLIVNNKMECIVIDWKFGKTALNECTYVRNGQPPKLGTGPCAKLPDCQYSKTALQLAIYNLLVQHCYKFTVRGMYVIQICSELPPPKYVFCPIDMSYLSVAREILQLRIDMFKEQQVKRITIHLSRPCVGWRR